MVVQVVSLVVVVGCGLELSTCWMMHRLNGAIWTCPDVAVAMAAAAAILGIPAAVEPEVVTASRSMKVKM